MTNHVLGLAPRWRTAFPAEWSATGSFAPRRYRDRAVALAGKYLVELDRDDGSIVRQTELVDAGLENVFAVSGDVVATEFRHPTTKRSHVLGYTDGALAWRAELPGSLGRSAAQDGAAMIGLLPGPPHQLAEVDLRTGAVQLTPTSHGGSAVARAADGTWIVGSSSPAKGNSGLYTLAAGTVTTANDVEHAVWKLRPSGDLVITAERAGTTMVGSVAARGVANLDLRWRAPALGGVVAVSDGVAIAVTGEMPQPVPVAYDLATGASRWTAEPLSAPIVEIIASGSLVLFRIKNGAALYSSDGRRLGTADGARVKDLVVDDDRVYITVDGDAVCVEAPR
jgi:hypothetical protein